MSKRKDEVLELTPKGKLTVLMMEGRSADEVWRAMRDFVELRARRAGYADGVPALVFDGGGACALVSAVKEGK